MENNIPPNWRQDPDSVYLHILKPLIFHSPYHHPLSQASIVEKKYLDQFPNLKKKKHLSFETTDEIFHMNQEHYERVMKEYCFANKEIKMNDQCLFLCFLNFISYF